MKRFLPFLCLLLMTTAISAQEVAQEVLSETTPQLAQELSYDRLLDGFARMYANSLHEKVYLMTDKPYYSAGERVWIRGWVVDAVSHTGQTPTNYLYIDLVDSGDDLIQRIKIKRDSTGFNNAIDLPADIKAGSYSLVAYTRWQTNWSEDLFFRRRIEVGNSIDDVVMHDVSYVLGEDSTATAVVRFYGFDGPYADCRVECIEKRGEKRDRSFTLRTDSYGQVFVEYTPLEGALGEIEMMLDVPNRLYTATVILPNINNSIDVGFMPEGGDLIAGVKQRVAFKAIGTDGYGRDVVGVVCDESGAEICPLATQYRGMGVFEFTPQEGKIYYAEVEYGNRKLRYAMPEVKSEGCALRIERDGDKWMCELLSAADFDRSNLSVLVHSRGALVYLVNDLTTSFPIPEKMLLEGISQVAVFNRLTGQILSERLLFRHPDNQFSVQTKTAFPVTRKRQKVSLDIKVVNASGEIVNGDYAVAVTDKRMVRRKSSDENIITSLLLTSDLGGFVEAPAEYFGAAREHTDLLMMTQGWRRFDIGEVIRDSVALPTIAFERSAAIEGRIFNAFNREPKGAQVLLHNSRTKQTEYFQLGDERNGKFRIEGLDYPDSTTYTITTLTRKGANMVLSAKLWEPRLPFPKAGIYTRVKDGKIEQYIPEEYLNTNKEKYYQEGGMRVIDIEEIVVKAKPLESSRFKGVRPTHVVYAAKFVKHYPTALDLALKIPGMRMKQGTRIGMMVTKPNREVLTMNAVLAGAPLSALTPRVFVSPRIYADDMPITQDDLLNIPSEDVISVSYISPARAGITDDRYVNVGALYYKLKAPYLRKSNQNPSVSKITPLGYKQKVEYYQPKYDVPNQPDLRTTVAWIPAVQFDEEGRATIEFYTADRATDYDVVIEGITEEGLPCSVQAVVERADVDR